MWQTILNQYLHANDAAGPQAAGGPGRRNCKQPRGAFKYPPLNFTACGFKESDQQEKPQEDQYFISDSAIVDDQYDLRPLFWVNSL